MFSPNLSSVVDLSRWFIRVPKATSQLLWKLQDHFCNTYEVVENEIFRKKMHSFQWRKVFGLYFLALSSVTNLRGNLWGSTRYSDNYCGSDRVNSVTHRKLLKTQTFEKIKANFQVKRVFGLFYLAFSSVTNLKGQYMMVHKVFWRLLWKLQC